MDYHKIPRSLVYKDRDNLMEFGVKNRGSVNQCLFSHLKEYSFLHSSEAKDMVTKCFNDAYYLCTLVNLEDFPELLVVEYEKTLLKNNNFIYREEICAVSMAMVCKLLPLYDDRWRQKDNDLIKCIKHRLTNYHWKETMPCVYFTYLIDNFMTDGFTLPHDEFVPRDIIETIKNVSTNELAKGTEYICEMLSRLDSPRKQMYGADLAIARLNDDLREIYKEWGYNPETNKFASIAGDPLGLDPQSKIDFFNYIEPKREAVEYIKEHYPKPKDCKETEESDKEIKTDDDYVKKVLSENEELKEKQAQYINENNTLRKDLAELKTELDNLKQPLTELDAAQKVRMALAFQLLKAAGLTDDMLKKWNSKQKAATIMSELLHIHNNNAKGNFAQTCATYLSAAEPLSERHKPTIEKLNTLMSELGIKIQL